MKIMTETEAKNSFDALMDTVQLEPILIMKRNLAVGMFLPMDKVKSIPELKNRLTDVRVGEVENPLLAMLGVNSQHRVFASSLEVDNYIDELRS